MIESTLTRERLSPEDMRLWLECLAGGWEPESDPRLAALTTPVLRFFASHPSPLVRGAALDRLAAAGRLRGNDWWAAGCDHDPLVRMRLAALRGVPSEVLGQLAGDPDVRVLRVVATRPWRLPVAVQTQLLHTIRETGEWVVPWRLAARDDVAPAVRRRLMTWPTAAVRLLAALGGGVRGAALAVEELREIGERRAEGITPPPADEGATQWDPIRPGVVAAIDRWGLDRGRELVAVALASPDRELRLAVARRVGGASATAGAARGR